MWMFVYLINAPINGQAIMKSDYTNFGSWTVDLGYGKLKSNNLVSINGQLRIKYFNLGMSFGGVSNTVVNTPDQSPYLFEMFTGLSFPIYHMKKSTVTANLDYVYTIVGNGEIDSESLHGVKSFVRYNRKLVNAEIGFYSRQVPNEMLPDLSGPYFKVGIGLNRFIHAGGFFPDNNTIINENETQLN